MKKIIVFCSALICTILLSITIVFATDTGKEAYYSEAISVDNLSTYRNDETGEYSYPDPQDGYLFAGWYKKNEDGKYVALTQAALNSATGDVYAKYVPEEILGVEAQISSYLTDAEYDNGDEVGAIRFVTSVDSLYYEKVGFEIDINGTTYDYSNKYVYDNLYVQGVDKDEAEAKSYVPSDLFHQSSIYFKAFTFTNLNSAYYRTGLTVQAYWTTMDGTTVYGEERTVTVNQGRYWNYVCVNGEAVAGTKDAGTFSSPFATVEDALAEMRECVAFQNTNGMYAGKQAEQCEVYITNTVNSDETVDILEGEDIIVESYGENATITRDGHTGAFFEVASGATLTMKVADSESLVPPTDSTGYSLIVDGGYESDDESTKAAEPLIIDNGTLNIEDNVFLQNNYNNIGDNNPQAGAIHVEAKAALNMTGGTISGNTGNRGGAIYIANGDESDLSNDSYAVNLTNVTLSDNDANWTGGAILVGKYRKVVMNGDTQIDGNTSLDGGGAIMLNSTGSTLNMNGGKISGNTAGNGGGAIYVSGGSDLTITGGTISENTANGTKGGGAIYTNGNAIEISNATISGNKATASAGAIFVNTGRELQIGAGTVIDNNTAEGLGGAINLAGSGSTLVMNGGAITGNTSGDNAGGVYVSESAVFTMADGEISENTASGEGGGVFIDKKTTVNITGGKINGNTGTTGGGIRVGDGDEADKANEDYYVSISGVEIANNTATTGSAGAVFVAVYRTVTVGDGAKISNNISEKHAGAINIAGNGTLNMTGGEISNNTANCNGGGNGGGAIYMSGSSKFNMSGGTISGNKAIAGNASNYGGGGIYVAAKAVLTITGGTISDNQSYRGGAIYFYNGGSGDQDNDAYTATLQNVTITGNKTNITDGRSGGAINIGQYRKLVINEGTVISENTSGTGGGAIDIASTGATLVMNGGKITGNTSGGHAGGVYVSGSTVFTMTGGEISGNTSSDEGGEGGGVFIGKKTTVTITGGKINGNTGINGGGIRVSDGDEADKDTEGYYVSISGVEIDNNTATGSAGAVFVGKYRTVTVGDGATISNNTAKGATTSGGGIYMSESSNFNMSGGTISGNKATHNDGNGGGIYVAKQAVLNITGGKLSENTANRGGAIYFVARDDKEQDSEAYTATLQDVEISGNSTKWTGGAIFVGSFRKFEMNEGTVISGNTSANAGGAIMLDGEKSTLVMNDGEISGNTANAGYGGGAVYVSGKSVLTMNGGAISSNTAQGTKGGGAVYVGSNATVEILGGELNGNTAQGAGGAIYLLDSLSAFKLENVTLNENTAEKGGAIYVPTGDELVIADGVTMKNNIAKPEGGAIYLDTSATLTMSGGTLSGNKANTISVTEGEETITYDGAGGAIYVGENATANITGGTISSNEAIRGGAIYLLAHEAATDSTDVTINGASITSNTTNITNGKSGGAIFVGNYRTVAITSGTVSNNTSGAQGGAINLAGIGAKLTMTGGTVSGNTAKGGNGGGAIYASEGSILTMSAGTISGNTADSTGNGGGIYVAKKSELNITGGTISGNTGYKGGAIYLISGDDGNQSVDAYTITLQNVEIKDNTANWTGGAIFVGNYRKVVMNTGAVISGNTSARGGGAIMLDGTESTLVMNDGEIKSNTDAADSTYTGAKGSVYISGNSVFIMNGGTISENKIAGAQTGQGVYCNGKTFELGANAIITDAIYLNATTPITVTGQLTNNVGTLTLNEENYTAGKTVVKAADDTELDMDLLLGKFSLADDSIYGLIVSDTKLVLSAQTVVTSYEELKTEIESATGAKSIALANDIAMDGTITVPSATSITLSSGYALERGASESAFFKIASGAAMTMVGDDAETFTLDGGYDSSDSSTKASQPLIINEGTLSIADNVVLQNNFSTSTEYDGGGVYTDGTFSLSGGTIQNTQANEGGGIYVSAGTFSMSDGTISSNINNSADYGGGAICIQENATVTITGGTISGNKAVRGGAIYLVGEAESTNSPTVTLKNVTITGNNTQVTDGKSAGAIFVGTYRKLKMQAGTSITNNTSAAQGGAINLAGAGSQLTMTGGTLSGNTAKGGNGGGALYVSSGSIFTMTGGKISGNKIASGKLGVGVYCNGTTFEIGDSANIADTIYLNNSATPITVTSSLTNPLGTISFTYFYRDNTVIVQNDAKMSASKLMELFTIDSSEFRLEADSSSNLVLSNAMSYLTLSGKGKTGTFSVSDMTSPTFTSSNTSVATVNANGVVTAVAEGNALIVAEENGVKRTCGVTVGTMSSQIDIQGKTVTGYKTNIQLAKDTHVMQGFAMKPDGTLYIIQQADDEGTNCVVTKVKTTGTKEYMHLNDFGHGNVISVEWDDEGNDYLWVPSVGTSDDTSNGLSRIPWEAGATYTTKAGKTWTSGIFYSNPNCSVDMDTRRLLVRVTDSRGGDVCYIYDLDGFVNGTLTDPLYRVDMAYSTEDGGIGSYYFQGIALSGNYIYRYEGNPDIAARISTIDMDGNCLNTRVVNFSDDVYYEAEGMAVINGKIYIGMATGSSIARRANIITFE